MAARGKQNAWFSLLRTVLPAENVLEEELAPSWLVRPGRSEARNAWPLLTEAYQQLTGRQLPDTMPPRETRRLDVLMTYPDGRQRAIEFDERQHFTAARLITLDLSQTVRVGFDVDDWRAQSIARIGREPGGGFARPCPPLFDEPGGRHKQRAFRDLIADTLPAQYGWLPTVRFHEYETREVRHASEPAEAMAKLWADKTR
ncbi:hypothetical protein [Leifsonia sp. fls2-241-R2A-40a]|uniref:hypothetical protein n=1 Tax=Leifsonia sp. fls2-241-R2A-40a TaxID=3040290 RepID=UPI00254A5652|nr:hypothetical protein [Leifsonia sp. fls2-241-R2A-40a]